jgi:hypothetical protein
MRKLLLIGVFLLLSCGTLTENEQKPKRVDSINYDGETGSGGGTGGDIPKKPGG